VPLARDADVVERLRDLLGQLFPDQEQAAPAASAALASSSP
jgi:hypothetical protein